MQHQSLSSGGSAAPVVNFADERPANASIHEDCKLVQSAVDALGLHSVVDVDESDADDRDGHADNSASGDASKKRGSPEESQVWVDDQKRMRRQSAAGLEWAEMKRQAAKQDAKVKVGRLAGDLAPLGIEAETPPDSEGDLS